MICLLAAGSSDATFELEDPAQELEEFQEAKALEDASVSMKVSTSAGLVQLAKRDYLKLLVGTYVNGFHQYNTTIWTSDEVVKIRIFHEPGDQGGAEEQAEHFRDHLQMVLGDPGYPWANDVEIEVDAFEIHN